MADNFGLKIGVESEKEFKNSLRDINRSFKVLGSEMNLVTSQFDKQDKSIEVLTARNEVLNKEVDAQKNKMGMLEAALKNAADSFGETDRRTQNWQIQLNNTKSELIKMEREVDKNNQTIDEMGECFTDAEGEVEEFADEVEKAAEQTENASDRFGKLGGALKGIGVTIGAAVAAIGTAALGGYGNFLTYASRVQKVFDEVALTNNLMEEQVSNNWKNILMGTYAEIRASTVYNQRAVWSQSFI